MGFLYAVEKKGADTAFRTLISDNEQGGPAAQASIKRLLNGDTLRKEFEEREQELAEFISIVREGSEAKEGIRSFLEKRKPEWCSYDS